MTKDQEIQHLRYFVAGLPRDSYVRDALEPFLVEFERGVYSDYVPTVSESWRHRVEAENEVKAIRKETEAAHDELKRAKARLRSFCVSVGSLADKAENLQRAMSAATTTLNEAYTAADSLYERTANL